MSEWSWPVLARQFALMLIPIALTYFKVPQAISDAISGPLVEVAAWAITAAGLLVLGWIISIGQRREKAKNKIAEVAKLPQVEKVEVTSEKLAASIPSRKVVA